MLHILLRRLGAALVLTLAASTAAAEVRREFGIWPLFYHESDATKKESTCEFIWPLLTRETRPGRSQVAFHPVISLRREEGAFDLHIVWPICRWAASDSASSFRILPVLFAHHRKEPDGSRTRSFLLLPVLFVRCSPGGDSLAVFPIFGILRQFLGQDRITFILFPLYVDAASGAYRTRHILWPLVGWGGGNGRRLARVLPLFSVKRDREGTRRISILWPFLHFQKATNPDTPSGFLVFPLYGRLRSNRRVAVVFLWPFLSYARTPSSRATTLFWPIFHRETGPETKVLRVWPLWGKSQSPDGESRFFLWPLYRSAWVKAGERENRYLQVLPFYWGREEVEEKTASRDSRDVFWPFCRIEEQTGGNSSVRSLYPNWFGDPEEGISRNYAVFWELYRFDADSSGNKSSRLLWRVYRHDRSREHRNIRALFLYNYHRDSEKKRVSLLHGLVGYRRDAQRRYVRVLWLLKIPFRGGKDSEKDKGGENGTMEPEPDIPVGWGHPRVR